MSCQMIKVGPCFSTPFHSADHARRLPGLSSRSRRGRTFDTPVQMLRIGQICSSWMVSRIEAMTLIVALRAGWQLAKNGFARSAGISTPLQRVSLKVTAQLTISLPRIHTFHYSNQCICSTNPAFSVSIVMLLRAFLGRRCRVANRFAEC